ncbi:MAG: DUF6626 family protein [Roseinatronobacter sp.]
MTLLEETYTRLRSNGLVDCAETFSRDYLGKNRNWFAYQKHAQRDFSVSAAVLCLRSLRNRQAAPDLSKQQRTALETAERALLAHLRKAHLVADVL